MWYSCAIAGAAWFKHQEWGDSISLSQNLRFEKVPNWIKDEKALHLLSQKDRRDILDADWALVTEYEADGLGAPDPEWKGAQARGIQDAVTEKFALMDVALWLTKPANIGIRQVLHFSRCGDPFSMCHYHSTPRILIRNDEIENVLEASDFEQASRFLNVIASLARDRTCWVAIWFLIRAVTEPLWQGRYLWQWIVLEGLFGSENPNETSYRLAQRIAFFTEKLPHDRKLRFKEMKDAYTWRSKLVHGGRTGSLTADKSEALTSVVEAVIRQGLKRILAEPEIVKIFDSKARDGYLEDLVFKI